VNGRYSKSENRNLIPAARTARPKFVFRFSFFAFLAALAACGTPGPPVPPRPTVPEAITDLGARQVGEAVVLTFTMPQKSIEGETLAEPPDVEIYRGTPQQRPGGTEPLPQVYTVPSALVDTYLDQGRVRFLDPLPPELLQQAQSLPGGRLELDYMVRTRASTRRASEESNAVRVTILPVPETVSNLTASVTERGIELRWTPPERTTSGGTIPSLASYRVYRAEVEAGAAPSATPPQGALLSVTPAPLYRDTQFEFGPTYIYTVRSVAQYESDSVESADSEPVQVTPQDTFPPAPPQNVVAVLVPATPESPAQFDLSWSISMEPDLAGYRVYRSAEEGTLGEEQNRELLLVPTFRDTSLLAGQRYFYRVTAVDRSGNESLPSAPVAAEVPGKPGP